jgi:hypothetical protein
MFLAICVDFRNAHGQTSERVNAPMPANTSRQYLIHGALPQTCQIPALFSRRTKMSGFMSKNAMVKFFDRVPMGTSFTCGVSMTSAWNSVKIGDLR